MEQIVGRVAGCKACRQVPASSRLNKTSQGRQGKTTARPWLSRLRQAALQRSNGLVFWLLVALSLSTLAACVILPEWRQYQVLHASRQVQQYRLDRLGQQIDRQQRHLDALRTDPAVVRRLAQRDLALYRSNEKAVFVPVAATAGATGELVCRCSSAGAQGQAWTCPWHMGVEKPFVLDPGVPLAASPPPIIAKLVTYLPDYDYMGLFCDGPTRLILMVMSTALMVFAFLLFGWRSTLHGMSPHDEG